MGQSSIQSLVIIILIASWIIFSLPLYAMGEKTNSEHSWYAFVPILNLVLFLEIAGKELWWILLFFIPCIGAIAAVIAWMAVAERMDKPAWVGALMLVPGVNIVIPFYLAYA